MGTANHDQESIENAGTQGAVLTPEPIERLREMGRAMGPEVPHRIIELYLGDAPLRLAALWRAHSAADARTLRETAHSLRGSSANLGASALAGLCQQLEAADSGVEEASRLRAVEAEYDKVEAAMRRLLAEFS